MQFYNISMQDYDVDSFTMPIQVGTLSINMQFIWPVEIQKLYDNEIQILNNIFNSQAFFYIADINNTIHIPFSYEVVSMWASYAQSPSLDKVNNTLWPHSLKEEVKAYIEDQTDTRLKTSIAALLVAIQPNIEYLRRLEEDLIWSVTTDLNGVIRETVINANVWLFQGYSDYRLSFSSFKEFIGRNDFNEVTLYIALGEGEL